MKHAILHAVVVSAAAMLALGTGSAHAQTTAPGPYYATPSWDQTLPSSTRFIVLSNMNSQAVLDRETGLVWEKSPDPTQISWVGALFRCIDRAVGGHKGWRLPSINELASLVDATVATLPPLPNGHPFTNIQISPAEGQYWSATTFADAPNTAWTVSFGLTHGVLGTNAKNTTAFAWCVRGGAALDNY